MRTALVTGSTDGIGEQTARELARAGLRVIVHGRDAEKTEVTRAVLARELPHATLDSVVFDFEDLDAVRLGAERLLRKYPELHILVNNAGIYALETLKTARGIELTFQVNYLAPFLLTQLMLPSLARGAPSRIVNVSSMAHAVVPLDLEKTARGEGFGTREAYSRSKLANLLFTRSLSKRLRGSGVTVNALHPGMVSTKLLEEGFGGTGVPLARGAKTSTFLALAPELAAVTGKYFMNGRAIAPHPVALDDTAAEQLWRFSESLLR